MIFGQDRQELRQMYHDAWQKSVLGEILSPLEGQISAVIAEHPEYHEFVTSDDPVELPPMETNPFLHMGLHLALRDQVATDRPPGIAALFRQQLRKYTDPHTTEHRCIDCLAETLWEAQNQGTAPDEEKYLDRVRQLSP
jgi:hypothetical protein